MKNENNFYDIINSKFSDRELPFDEENWKSMKKMIDDSRDSKRRILWLFISLALLICVAGAFAFYSWNNGRGKSGAGSANTSVASTTSKTISTNDKLNTNSAPSTNQPTSAATKISGNTDNSTVNSTKSVPITNNQPGINTIASGQTMAHASSSGKNNKSSHISASGNRGTMSGNKPATRVSVAQASGIGSIAGNDKQAGGLTQNVQPANTIPGTKDPANNTVASSQKVATPSSPLAVKKTTELAAKNGIHKTDTIGGSEPLPQRFSNEPRVFMGKTNLFSVDAGTQYSGGWQIGSVVQGKGFNIVVGVGYSHYMGSTIFLKAGLQFSTFGNMSPLTYNYQHNVGHVFYDSVITTQRLYFLRLPIQVEYFVGRKKRSSIGIGGALWYMIGSTGYATTYQQTDNNPPVNMQRYSQNTPLDGYSTVNVSAHIFYRYVLSEKISMYLMPYIELTNMKDNTFFGENIIERTRGFEYILSYNLN